MEERTERQKIVGLLIKDSAKASEISQYLKIEEDEVVEQIKQITNHSQHDVYVKPPECRSCGFENFKNLKQPPSTCPNCNSTSLTDMEYSIR